jgi:hypothetical protein
MLEPQAYTGTGPGREHQSVIEISEHVFPLFRRTRDQKHDTNAVSGSRMDRFLGEETPTEEAFVTGICFGQIAGRHGRLLVTGWSSKKHRVVPFAE